MNTNTVNLTTEQLAAMSTLVEAENQLKALGFHITRSAALYISEDSSYFSSRIASPFGPDEIMFDHAVMDAVRDISVEWHNIRHKDGDRLKWEDEE